jgi:hypothetical protein
LALAAALARRIALSIPSVTKVKVRAGVSFGCFYGGEWINTKIGTWNS